MSKTRAIILAAGLGTRMKSSLPKVLHPIGNTTLLGMVVRSLKLAGIKEIIAVVGYRADLVEEMLKGEDISFVKQEKQMGSGDALKSAAIYLEDISGNTIVTCGDAPLITGDTYKRLLNNSVMFPEIACTMLTCDVENPFSYGRIVRDKEGNVTRIVEEKDANDEQKKIKEVNVGTYCFHNVDFKKYLAEIRINEKKQEYYLTDIVEIMNSYSKKVGAVSCVREEFIGVNSRQDLAIVNKLFNNRVLEQFMNNGVTILDPNTIFIDENVVIGEDTVIFPFTIIEAGAKIGKNCKLGPFVRIVKGTVLEAGESVSSSVEL
ncbi:bifunctional N-acetylglucosamine-1-phosphate uridyltransferase/glucosamine-1-phosphate acetyltransferase [Candidatus Omnitrophus magneticus]|uniref:Bifunctional N-acetylglucosamine-1-phosphate uridyltransferase/glucosamine-1-phosphate acetyltransferase n=1 Tax=Candidatus Omnitrophus magneticus TaxID=1609969 RepID=A0A0F0CQE9_9BACT|nr:bifunctional N-acetylglucosamine-1-phosphate uridyltransferase/glucosamine-1-phosphate acetyltransferase [Candidatus Omnitrophus magneticus]